MTEILPLQSSTSDMSACFEDLEYFKQKIWQSLGIPKHFQYFSPKDFDNLYIENKKSIKIIYLGKI